MFCFKLYYFSCKLQKLPLSRNNLPHPFCGLPSEIITTKYTFTLSPFCLKSSVGLLCCVLCCSGHPEWFHYTWKLNEILKFNIRGHISQSFLGHGSWKRRSSGAANGHILHPLQEPQREAEMRDRASCCLCWKPWFRLSLTPNCTIFRSCLFRPSLHHIRYPSTFLSHLLHSPRLRSDFFVPYRLNLVSRLLYEEKYNCSDT